MLTALATTSFAARILVNESLAKHTTFGIGGPADYYVELENIDELNELWVAAQSENLTLLLLGGGSNVLICETGWRGLVARLKWSFIDVKERKEDVIVFVSAGVVWDELVAKTVDMGLAGLESMSGIPGLVGAAPMQNIACYGASVSDSIVSVSVFDLTSGDVVELSKDDCDFGYRQSRFKHDWRSRYIVTGVTFALRKKKSNFVRYDEISQLLGVAVGEEAATSSIRAAVLEARRNKSMVLDSGDPDTKSAGSFFTNPVVNSRESEFMVDYAKRISFRPPVFWPMPNSEKKVAAAWLIEAAGFTRGYVLGKAKNSDRHALALVALPGATASDILELAKLIRGKVREVFGITLVPEPDFIGFEKSVDELLG